MSIFNFSLSFLFSSAISSFNLTAISTVTNVYNFTFYMLLSWNAWYFLALLGFLSGLLMLKNCVFDRYEEYIDYMFPEETQATNLKILEAAYKWKKQKVSSDSDED